jgi:hypothetical protein
MRQHPPYIAVCGDVRPKTALQDSTLYINWDECDLLLSYAALGLSPAGRRAIFDRHDTSTDAQLNRLEFVSLCAETLSSVPLDLITAAMENRTAARTSKVRRTRAYWATWSRELDVWSRSVIPLTYVFSLILVFTGELDDDYLDNDEAQIVNGFTHVYFSPADIAIMIVFVVVAAIIGIVWIRLKQAAMRRTMRDQTDLNHAGFESMTTVVRASRKNLFDTVKRCSVAGAVTAAPAGPDNVTSLQECGGGVANPARPPP